MDTHIDDQTTSQPTTVTIPTTEYEHMQATIDNLRLFIDFVHREYPWIYERMEARYDGLPGFVSPTKVEEG